MPGPETRWIQLGSSRGPATSRPDDLSRVDQPGPVTRGRDNVGGRRRRRNRYHGSAIGSHLGASIISDIIIAGQDRPRCHRRRQRRSPAQRTDWPDQARALSPSGAGFDLVLDPVGRWSESVRALRPAADWWSWAPTWPRPPPWTCGKFYSGPYDLSARRWVTSATSRAWWTCSPSTAYHRRRSTGSSDSTTRRQPTNTWKHQGDSAKPYWSTHDREATCRLRPAPGASRPGRSVGCFLVLDDPARRNALSDSLLDHLMAGLQRAAADPEVRVIVLTSSHEKVFSSGGNLDAFADTRPPITKYAGIPGEFPGPCPDLDGNRQAGGVRGRRRRAGRGARHRPGL